MAPAAWLMKAEPDSRIVKGKDVKFSVDDFEHMGVSHWDGVRNPEASKSMRLSMKIGDKVLFYHSNTKTPGIAAFAEVAKEGYPDHTAWDPHHPYYDTKTDKEKPKWYMVDVKFVSRAKNFVPLALLKHLATLAEPPAELSYLTPGHLTAIKNMALLGRGRLSVQPVNDPVALEAVEFLAEKGGWDEETYGAKKPTRGKRDADGEPEAEDEGGGEQKKAAKVARKKKPDGEEKKPKAAPKPRAEGSRRSSRLKGE